MRQSFRLNGAKDYEHIKLRIDYTDPKTVKVLWDGEDVDKNEMENGAMA